MKAAMAGTGGAGNGRDGQRRDILDISLSELRSEGRGVGTTGGAELGVVWCVGFGGWVYPTPNVV